MAKKKNSLATLSVEFDTKDIADGLSKVSANMAKFGAAAVKQFAPVSKSGAKAFGDLAKASEKSLGHLSKSLVDMSKVGGRSFDSLSKSASSSLGSITKMISSVHKDWLNLGKSIMGGGGGGGLMGGLTQGLGIGAGLGALKGLAHVITAPFTNIGQAILDSSEIEIVDRKFKSVFGSMTGSAERFAREFAGKVGQSESGIKGTMSRFQDTLVPMGFGRKQATDISKNMTSLSTDLAASEGITQTEAADRLVSGMVGNHEALRRFGVVITETTLNAKLLAMGIKGGSKAATEQEKAIARLNLVIAGTRDAQGTAARAGGSFATEMGSLNAMLMQVSGTIGNAFKPAATEVIKFFREGLSNVSGNLSGATEWGKSLGKATKNVLDGLKEVRTWVEQSIGKVGGYFGKISDVLAAATKDTKAFAEVIGKVKDMIGVGIEIAVADFQKEGIAVIGALSGGIMGAIGVAGDEIRGIFKDVAYMVADIVDSLMSKFRVMSTMWSAITKAALPAPLAAMLGGSSTSDDLRKSADNMGKPKLGKDGKPVASSFMNNVMEGIRSGYAGAKEGVEASGMNASQNKRRGVLSSLFSGLMGMATDAKEPDPKSLFVGPGRQKKTFGEKLKEARENFRKDGHGSDSDKVYRDLLKSDPRTGSAFAEYSKAKPGSKEQESARSKFLSTVEDVIKNEGGGDGKIRQIKPEQSTIGLIGKSLRYGLGGILNNLTSGYGSNITGEAPVKDIKGKTEYKTTGMATLAGLADMAYANIGYEKPKAKVQYGDVQSTYKSIQSSLGGKDDKREALRMKILEKQKELAEKTLKELQKAPDAIGKAISQYIGLT